MTRTGAVWGGEARLCLCPPFQGCWGRGTSTPATPHRSHKRAPVRTHQRINRSPIIFGGPFLNLYIQGLQDTVNVVDEVLQLLHGGGAWRETGQGRGGHQESVTGLITPSTRAHTGKARGQRRPSPPVCGSLLSECADGEGAVHGKAREMASEPAALFLSPPEAPSLPPPTPHSAPLPTQSLCPHSLMCAGSVSIPSSLYPLSSHVPNASMPGLRAGSRDSGQQARLVRSRAPPPAPNNRLHWVLVTVISPSRQLPSEVGAAGLP